MGKGDLLLRNNVGKRNPLKGKKGKPKISRFHKDEEKFKRTIIDYYLPLLISGETTKKEDLRKGEEQ